MPSQIAIPQMPSSFLTDTSSDFPIELDSPIDQKWGERCLKFVEDRINQLSMPDHQSETLSGAHVGRFSLKTEQISLDSKTVIPQHLVAGFSRQELFALKTSNEPHRNNYIATLADLNSLAFEYMRHKPAAAPVKQLEIVHVSREKN